MKTHEHKVIRDIINGHQATLQVYQNRENVLEAQMGELGKRVSILSNEARHYERLISAYKAGAAARDKELGEVKREREDLRTQLQNKEADNDSVMNANQRLRAEINDLKKGLEVAKVDNRVLQERNTDLCTQLAAVSEEGRGPILNKSSLPKSADFDDGEEDDDEPERPGYK